MDNRLTSGNLHLKPLCAHLNRATLWIATTLQQNATTTHWHGRVVFLLSKAILISGSAVAILIALIEALALAFIATAGKLIDKYGYDHSSKFLQKHITRFYAQALNSAFVAIFDIALIWIHPNLKYHTPAAVFDHALRLGSSVASIRGTEQTLFPRRDLIQDWLQEASRDVTLQLQRDLGENFVDRLPRASTFRQYLEHHPQDQNFIQNLNFRRLFTDPDYLEEALGRIVAILTALNLARANGVGAVNNPLLVELNSNPPEVIAYQDLLAHYLKSSFLELHRSEQMNRNRLEALDASIFPPLIAYSQYKELKEEIQCPEQFTGRLQEFTNRRLMLQAAKAQVEALNPDQQDQLITKILRGADFTAQGAVQMAYLEINRLAAPLQQGPLMTKVFLNLRGILTGAFEELMDTQNLFQTALQEALEEVG